MKPGQMQACRISGGTGVVAQKGGGKGKGKVDTGGPIGSQQGTVKRYGPDKGFGFITAQDGVDVLHLCIFWKGPKRGLIGPKNTANILGVYLDLLGFQMFVFVFVLLGGGELFPNG